MNASPHVINASQAISKIFKLPLPLTLPLPLPLTLPHLQAISKIFKLLDVNKDGDIEKKELRGSMAKVPWPKCRLGRATAHCPGLLGWTLQAPGCTTYSRERLSRPAARGSPRCCLQRVPTRPDSAVLCTQASPNP